MALKFKFTNDPADSKPEIVLQVTGSSDAEKILLYNILNGFYGSPKILDGTAEGGYATELRIGFDGVVVEPEVPEEPTDPETPEEPENPEEQPEVPTEPENPGETENPEEPTNNEPEENGGNDDNGGDEGVGGIDP